MPGLGLGLSGVSASIGVGATAVAIEDYMWNLVSAGNLQPLAAGTVSDFHDTWDLDGTDYPLAAVGTVRDEGYWNLDSSSDVQPLDV